MTVIRNINMGNSSRLIYVSPDRKGFNTASKCHYCGRIAVATDSEGHYVCENCSNERKKSSNTST